MSDRRATGEGTELEPDQRSGEPAAALEQLGRYALLCELGSGGMATLYLGRVSGPVGFEKLVAIKRIHPHLAKQRYFVDMFLDEARIAAQVHHPNVAQIFDLGEEGGRFYIVMEYVEGESLSQLMRALLSRPDLRQNPRALPWALCASIVADAAAGLHAAHELRALDGQPLGLVHRDVSPQNILVTYDGFAKLVDFGVAKARGRITSTVDRHLKGKIPYMSPEQVQGFEIDRRSDIFALGVVLYEVTCGRRLFKEATEAGTMQRIIDGVVPPPSTVRPGYPPALEQVVLQALARTPEARYQTADAMRLAIQQALRATGPLPVTGDVAELMRRTFPTRERARAQLREAGRSGTVPTSDLLRELQQEDASIVEAVARLRGPAAPRPRRRRRPLALALGLTAVGGLLAWQGARTLWFERDGPIAAPPSGALRIVSDPPGAAVVVDGASVPGATPLVVSELGLGPHRVELQRAGHEPWERTLTLERAGQEIVVEVALRGVPPAEALAAGPSTAPASAPATAGAASATLVHAPEREPVPARKPVATPRKGKRRPAPAARAVGHGLLTIATEPWAEVWGDGRRLGETPLVNFKLPAGVHTLELRPEGKKPGKTLKITLRAGQHLRRQLDLR